MRKQSERGDSKPRLIADKLQLMRLRMGAPFYAGCFFAALILLFVYLTFSNFRAYFTMRSAEVRVLASDLKIDIFPAPDSDSVPYLGYLLNLKLETTDESRRQISWDTEAGKAAYPEEAFDELKNWAPGSIHRIQLLRGAARAVRIESLESNRELEGGIGALIGLAILLLIAGVCFAASKIEGSEFEGKKSNFWGTWVLFAGFGMLPLIGWVWFTASFVSKAYRWIPVTAQVATEAKAFDFASAPANVEITASAKEKLQSSQYRVFTFPWNGKVLHGAIGSLGGEFDDKTGPTQGGSSAVKFHISPKDRWALQLNFGTGQDFWLPFLALLLIGLAFTGAGLGLRSIEKGPATRLTLRDLRKRKF